MATVVHETLQLNLINKHIADNTIHALTLLGCVPAKCCVSAFIESFSNVADARHVLCVSLLLLCQYSHSVLQHIRLFFYVEMFHAARGKACVDPAFFMYFHCLLAFLPRFASLI